MAGSWQPQEAGVNCNLYCTGTDWGKKESGKKKGGSGVEEISEENNTIQVVLL